MRSQTRPHRLEDTTVLYVGPETVVTRTWLSRYGQRYDVADLSAVVRVRGSRHGGTYVATLLAAINALLFIPAAVLTRAPSLLVMAVVAVLVPSGAAWICARRWPPRQELWARYGGTALRLFASRDQREFGQMSRAVQRALESAR